MKAIKCPCEKCVVLSICQERVEVDSSLKEFRKNTECKDLSKYLRIKGTTKYYRMDKTRKVLGALK